ncbi:hypothetical protein C5167_026775 [Papaver somniferum]|nr:hypothetical protein C5167_026775 [Papaver somniferum]
MAVIDRGPVKTVKDLMKFPRVEKTNYHPQLNSRTVEAGFVPGLVTSILVEIVEVWVRNNMMTDLVGGIIEIHATAVGTTDFKMRWEQKEFERCFLRVDAMQKTIGSTKICESSGTQWLTGWRRQEMVRTMNVTIQAWRRQCCRGQITLVRTTNYTG